MATKSGSSFSQGADISARSKYSKIPADDTKEVGGELEINERSSLLDNMENISISDQANPGKKKSGSGSSDVGQTLQETANKRIDAPKTRKVQFEQSEVPLGVEARQHASNTEQTVETGDDDSVKPNDPDKLDIVRKMSEPNSEGYIPWQRVGPYHTLKSKMCQRLYANSGRADDIALFFVNGRFHCMDAWCSHMGGPLFEGDIEDYRGKHHVMCPWHSYMFDLETGMNEIGLQQKLHEVKYEAGQIYVRYHSEVYVEQSRVAHSRKISEFKRPPPVPCVPLSSQRSGASNVTRKDSILENVMKI